MIFMAIITAATALGIVGVVALLKRSCWVCVTASLAILIGGSLTTNAVVVWFLNSDAPSADRGAALSTAICGAPLPGTQQVTVANTIRCSTVDTLVGTDITVTSEAKLDDVTQRAMIERIRLLRPLITKKRINVAFTLLYVASSGEGIGPDGKQYKFIQRKTTMYRLVPM